MKASLGLAVGLLIGQALMFFGHAQSEQQTHCCPQLPPESQLSLEVLAQGDPPIGDERGGARVVEDPAGSRVGPDNPPASKAKKKNSGRAMDSMTSSSDPFAGSPLFRRSIGTVEAVDYDQGLLMGRADIDGTTVWLTLKLTPREMREARLKKGDTFNFSVTLKRE